MTQKEWYAAEVTATPTAGEAIEYGLMEAGALGTETTSEMEGEVRITGYFQQPIDETKLQRALIAAWRLYNHVPTNRIDVRLRAFADRDWLAEWKKRAQLRSQPPSASWKCPSPSPHPRIAPPKYGFND